MASMDKSDSHSADSHSTDSHSTDAQNISDDAKTADATISGAQMDADENSESTSGFTERSAPEPGSGPVAEASPTKRKRTRESAHLRRSRQRRRGVFFWLELLFFAIIFFNAAYITVGKAMEGSYGWLAFGIIALVLGVGGLVFRFTRPARFDGPVENSPEEQSELVELITSGKRVEAARKLRQWHPGLTLTGAVDEIQRIEREEGIKTR